MHDRLHAPASELLERAAHRGGDDEDLPDGLVANGPEHGGEKHSAESVEWGERSPYEADAAFEHAVHGVHVDGFEDEPQHGSDEEDDDVLIEARSVVVQEVFAEGAVCIADNALLRAGNLRSELRAAEGGGLRPDGVRVDAGVDAPLSQHALERPACAARIEIALGEDEDAARDEEERDGEQRDNEHVVSRMRCWHEIPVRSAYGVLQLIVPVPRPCSHVMRRKGFVTEDMSRFPAKMSEFKKSENSGLQGGRKLRIVFPRKRTWLSW